MRINMAQARTLCSHAELQLVKSATCSALPALPLPNSAAS